MRIDETFKHYFAGTPDFAAQHLQALLASQHQVIAVYTQPDKPAGRGKKLQPSAVKQLALAHNLPIFPAKSLRKEGSTTISTIKCRCNGGGRLWLDFGGVGDAPFRLFECTHGSLLPRCEALRRFNVRFGQAMSKPVSPIMQWMKVWIPAICCISQL